MTDIKLTPEQEATVRQNLKDLREYGNVLAKISQCGVDCSGLENLRTYMLDKFEKINEHFVPQTGDKRLLG